MPALCYSINQNQEDTPISDEAVRVISNVNELVCTWFVSQRLALQIKTTYLSDEQEEEKVERGAFRTYHTFHH